jgi:hypothetical protein
MMTPSIHNRADDVLSAVLGRNLQTATGRIVLYLVIASIVVAVLTSV